MDTLKQALAECPLCGQTSEIDYFSQCIDCGEYICSYCYNPNQERCAQCERDYNMLKEKK